MTQHSSDSRPSGCSLASYRQVIKKASIQPQVPEVTSSKDGSHGGSTLSSSDSRVDPSPSKKTHESGARSHEPATNANGSNLSSGRRKSSPESVPSTKGSETNPFDDSEANASERDILCISDSDDDCSDHRPGKSHLRQARHPNRRKTGRCYLNSGNAACDQGDASDDWNSSDSDDDAYTSNFAQLPHKRKMKRWKSFAHSRFEKMFLDCIVNTDNIPSNYSNMSISSEVIAKVERVTALSLNRPKAFSFGVLKDNRVTGAILWGPPGTGKTLLVKGVAKQSGYNMISVSTAEMWQKCHGDDEKAIQALFSMARKMHPCIVFIDEADAMLGERKAGEKRHIRAMMNMFLSSWDGITNGKNSPFILLATNRPNDLDAAVLRRAPVRIELGLPTAVERQGILCLLLKGEKLADDVTFAKLANLTRQYTGSDLKSLCVTAATDCVAESPVDSDVRILRFSHFLAAMEIVKATSLSKTREMDLKNFQNNHNEQVELVEE